MLYVNEVGYNSIFNELSPVDINEKSKYLNNLALFWLPHSPSYMWKIYSVFKSQNYLSNIYSDSVNTKEKFKLFKNLFDIVVFSFTVFDVV